MTRRKCCREVLAEPEMCAAKGLKEPHRFGPCFADYYPNRHPPIHCQWCLAEPPK